MDGQQGRLCIIVTKDNGTGAFLAKTAQKAADGAFAVPISHSEEFAFSALANNPKALRTKVEKQALTRGIDPKKIVGLA